MKKINGRADYKAVNLPMQLLDQVDEIVKKDRIYRSRAEFVKDCINKRIQNIKEWDAINKGKGKWKKVELPKDNEWLIEKIENLPTKEEFEELVKKLGIDLDKPITKKEIDDVFSYFGEKKPATKEEIEDIFNKNFNKRLEPLQKQLNKLTNEIHKK